MILHRIDVGTTAPAPGVTRRVLANGPKLMLVEFTFEAGRTMPVHTHAHEQVGYVVSGRIGLTMEGILHELVPGDSYHVLPNVPHGVAIREAAVVLDTFTPPREDFR
jgi:quercetin dioxygenase-like cupin family protein